MRSRREEEGGGRRISRNLLQQGTARPVHTHMHTLVSFAVSAASEMVLPVFLSNVWYLLKRLPVIQPASSYLYRHTHAPVLFATSDVSDMELFYQVCGRYLAGTSSVIEGDDGSDTRYRYSGYSRAARTG